MRLLSRRRELSAAAPGPTRAELDLARLVEGIGRLPIGVLVESEDGAMVAANDRALRPIGEMQGDTLASDLLRRVVASARAGDSVSQSLELRGSGRRVLQVSAQPLTSGGVVATVVDTSERRRLADIRSDFVANVNHELRTPIGAIAVLAEALADETDPVATRRLAGRMGLEAERATSLLGDLLDFSRVEETPPVSTERLDVSELIADAADRVQSQAEAGHIKLELPDAAGPDVVGERAQLVSALTNLIDNAVKYSDPGGTVSIGADTSGSMVAIRVQDWGRGIPAKDLDRIFERFFRVDRARERRTGGSGLGLAIVRHVATNHGGDVTVSSTEGEGSVFTLLLPSSGELS